MKSISAAVVEKTWQSVSEYKEARIVGLMDIMSKEQPVVVAFLMATDEDLLTQEEKELLVYLGLVVWQMMSKGDKTLRKVSEKRLLDANDANTLILESLVDASEGNFEVAVEKMLSAYPQPEVLRFVVDALVEAQEEEEGVTEEHIGIMMMDLKTVIDCLNQ